MERKIKEVIDEVQKLLDSNPEWEQRYSDYLNDSSFGSSLVSD